MSATQRNAQFGELLARLRWVESQCGEATAFLEGEPDHVLFCIYEYSDDVFHIEGAFVPLMDGNPPGYGSIEEAKGAAASYLCAWMLRRWDEFEALNGKEHG